MVYRSYGEEYVIILKCILTICLDNQIQGSFLSGIYLYNINVFENSRKYYIVFDYDWSGQI